MLPPRVLVTGADGLVGQALARRLSRWPGLDLLLTGRGDGPRLAAFEGGWVPLDVTDARAVERVMQDFEPNAVVHLAAMSKVEPCEREREACWEVNVHATERLARACRRHGARLVFLSTDFVFDGASGPYAEEDRPAPINAYGRSKLAAENAIRGSGLRDWSIVRTTLGFGDVTGYPEGRFNLATFLARELSAGRAVHVTSDQWRTPTLGARSRRGHRPHPRPAPRRPVPHRRRRVHHDVHLRRGAGRPLRFRPLAAAPGHDGRAPPGSAAPASRRAAHASRTDRARLRRHASGGRAGRAGPPPRVPGPERQLEGRASGACVGRSRICVGSRASSSPEARPESTR